jgi:hypothetical protein
MSASAVVPVTPSTTVAVTTEEEEEEEDIENVDDDNHGDDDDDDDNDAITVEDVTYPVFLKVLEFLYTDGVAGLGPGCDWALPLLIAAERFLLARLKGLCEDAIRQEICAGNVVATLLAAHRHRAEGLKDMCLEFLLAHLDHVKRSEGFAELKAEPDLLMEIILRGP